jgi:Hypervirulence associated proteins TUDOR domain
MSDKLKKGDHVEWNTSGGKTEGEIKEVITEPTDFKGHHFEASEENPEYRVESNKSHKDAIHKPEQLKKVKD